MDGEARYFYGNRFSIGGNITWQKVEDRERYEMGGVKDPGTYKDRMPNVPYLFSNVDAAYNFI